MTMGFDRRILLAALRQDLVSFIERTVQTVAPVADYLPNWHIDAIAYHLEQCFDRRIRRLIITLPPRNLKSICASVAFPAWVLGRDPRQRIICASYANELTVKHARDCRVVMESAWYKEVFPGTRLNPKKCTELEFETTQQGYRYSTSLGGALTGRGGSILIVDDPIKASDATSDLKRQAVKEWFDGTLYTRLDNKKEDVIIVVMQRVHVDDLVGHLLEKDSEWTHLDLPAIAIEDQEVPVGPSSVYYRKAGEVLHDAREPKKTLDEAKAAMGSYAFPAQYQQRPAPVEGNLIKWEWSRTYDYLAAYGSNGWIVQSWDTASKAGELNDYSVCTTWLIKDNLYYLVDVFRQRLEYPQLRKAVIEMARLKAAQTVLIEDKASGTQLIQDMRATARAFRPIAIEPESDKITRMSTQSAQIEAGHVLIPKQAPWLIELKREMLAFPHGKYNDQVDSVSQFLNWAMTRRCRTVRWSHAVGWY